MSFTFPRRGRLLAAGQRAELTIIDLAGNARLVLTAHDVIEAPNWSPDGGFLVFNAGGLIYRIAADGSGEPQRIDTGSLADLNNDHVLSPDGNAIYVSSDDGHLYAVPFAGGTPRRISNTHAIPHHYYLHGISPDGATLSYVAIEGSGHERRVNVFTIPTNGGPDTRLTDVSVPNDGPEYSPDGRWIYFNSELAASRPGHAQIFRMAADDGTNLEQLTFDSLVNWFPHLSPDGRQVVFLSYPQGTMGHPADKDVLLRLMNPDGSNQRTLVSFFGGQGSINVNSWAPDSQQLAYVSYPKG
ncbi:biopolymer transporter Tol [Devosia limi DSM 17137]|uniref:Biopolymer transporter Tol n=1 Tax=Devosia limi DSM 17137 TaxID=1121477 RepID=A0A0F5LRQ2_9HYPH|nr:PD40 domain-containing protein [Devosia limi]KKB85025.1 biopolymer transporter Tol [Devosia limi DSM 17137]SHF04326.1 WD40-like Beta Propeller Repeat [Devosia limi DSM 17137]